MPLVSGTQTAPAPTFPGGTNFLGSARVELTCNFGVITPIVTAIVGSTVAVSASAEFPVRTAMIVPGGGGTRGSTPTTAFHGSPTSGPGPLTVQFTDDSVPAATSWFWTFGDGATSTEQNPIHTYASGISTYSVSLAVENDFGSGSPDPLLKLNYIGVLDSSNADFSADKTSGTAPLLVNFTDLSSPVPTAWAWTFGDGGTSTVQNPSHTFAPGTWTVSLQADVRRRCQDGHQDRVHRRDPRPVHGAGLHQHLVRERSIDVGGSRLHDNGAVQAGWPAVDDQEPERHRQLPGAVHQPDHGEQELMLAAARRTHAQRAGQALAEFALIVPIIVLFMVAAVDVGRGVYAYNSITNAVREGARMAIVNQDLNLITVRAIKETAIAETAAPNLNVKFLFPNAAGAPDASKPCGSPVPVGCLAVVGYETRYQPITPVVSILLWPSGVTLSATAVLPVEFTCPNAATTAAQCPKQP